MTELIAKPIIKDQFWIVTDGQKKVGNIEANGTGFGMQLNGNTLQFNSADEIQQTVHITFDSYLPNPATPAHPYPDIPTPAKIYNSVVDVTRGLHLFTETRGSKCLHAAGWFSMRQPDGAEAVFCPKYIFIQRYPYVGPFKTKAEAELALNTI